jgi:thioesterase domain-containing protein
VRSKLGGFCNGGLLAWELAHQLESLGPEIEFLVLLETRSFNARLPIRMIARLTKLIAAVAPEKISGKFKLDAMHGRR